MKSSILDSSSSVVNDPSKQHRSTALVITESTEIQEATEEECAPFFVDLATLRNRSLDHLRDTGLLPPASASSTHTHNADAETIQHDVMDVELELTLTPGSTSDPLDVTVIDNPHNNNDNDNKNNNSTKNNEEDEHDLDICLLRNKHYDYLSRVFLPDKQPLGRNLVSLDASRPWMLYWTLHGCDLLLLVPDDDDHNNNTITDNNNNNNNNNQQDTTVVVPETSLLFHKVGDAALCAVVSTLEACWQSIEHISLPQQYLNLTDHDLSLLEEAPAGTSSSSSSGTDNKTTDNNSSRPSKMFVGGGFGGGPQQMAHAATTYAAILTLCIIATSSSGSSSSDMAWKVLDRIRKPLYAWFLSLQQQPSGGFRMHHDGEIDVRASYTIFCVAKLLNILTPTLASPSTVNFIASCQTYEGGFGGEPFTEAHGGYAYCAVAALQLLDQLYHHTTTIDMDALLGWLARRQMGYEGGFSGRANKLVDGCYSFWQGGAMAIVSAHYDRGYSNPTFTTTTRNATTATATAATTTTTSDIWLPSNNDACDQENDGGDQPLSYALLFDKPMLQRYILLCAQDVNGGLRDKPSKPRDFYHSCYNLAGLALSQHSGSTNSSTTASSSGNFGHPVYSRVARSHPCYNIRLDRVQMVLDRFQTSASS